MPVGIDHWIETRQVARGVRIAERCNNASVGHLAAQLSGDGLPLTGCCLQSDIAIGGYAMSVHDDTHTTLMTLWIEIAESHYISTAGIEIAVLIQLKSLRCCS